MKIMRIIKEYLNKMKHSKMNNIIKKFKKKI